MHHGRALHAHIIVKGGHGGKEERRATLLAWGMISSAPLTGLVAVKDGVHICAVSGRQDLDLLAACKWRPAAWLQLNPSLAGS